MQDAICASLTAYNEHIEELKQKMREATQSANMIRKDIQAMRSKCVRWHEHTSCMAQIA